MRVYLLAEWLDAEKLAKLGVDASPFWRLASPGDDRLLVADGGLDPDSCWAHDRLQVLSIELPGELFERYEQPLLPGPDRAALIPFKVLAAVARRAQWHPPGGAAPMALGQQ